MRGETRELRVSFDDLRYLIDNERFYRRGIADSRSRVYVAVLKNRNPVLLEPSVDYCRCSLLLLLAHLRRVASENIEVDGIRACDDEEHNVDMHVFRIWRCCR